MIIETSNKATVIKKNDPDFPAFLDFEKLRKEGLEHIGKLAGNIWTDHNVHDPGVTILEVLIYALIDLGYKTSLPLEDLITSRNPQVKDDNFFTPLEILTSNPVTITDYRKLLLEIDEVANVWLEPILPTKQNPKQHTGIYKISVEKGNSEITDPDLTKKITNTLHQYRNICEDFEPEISFLTKEDIEIQLQIEIHEGFDAATTYKQVYEAVSYFIQPRIRYYTLEELLNKGKTIDEAFAGKSYSTKSVGFIDTDELNAIQLRTHIYTSDLYHVILAIEGVRKIKKLVFTGGTPIPIVTDTIWYKGYQLNGAPNLTKFTATLYDRNNTIIYTPEADKQLASTPIAKTVFSTNDLDFRVPTGRYREDLGDYYSIQNDFPVVYGIGEEGISGNATLLRKTQALQLKGYLLFYDQLLANYTAQIENMRTLFSLKPENQRRPVEQQTYFTKISNSVPGIEKLFSFYTQNANEDKIDISFVVKDKKWQEQIEAIRINRIVRFPQEGLPKIDPYTLKKLDDKTVIDKLLLAILEKRYRTEILLDSAGYFFIIEPCNIEEKEIKIQNIAIFGNNRYVTKQEAIIEVKKVLFTASLKKNYTIVEREIESKGKKSTSYFLEFVQNDVEIKNNIQELTESGEEYLQRRKLFLDHLLARFGEKFTEYSLLQYKKNKNSQELQEELVQDQSSYLSEFAEISRNRGKAFNYKVPSWNTSNVSGFEKRVAALAGMKMDKRKNIVPFQYNHNAQTWKLKSYDTPYAFTDSFKTKDDADVFKTMFPSLFINIDDVLKEMILCPKSSADGKFHYQIVFKNKENKEFKLVSCQAFSSISSATKAWEKEFINIIKIATDPQEYEKSGRIGREPEDGKIPVNTNWVAVIPKEITTPKKELVETYVALAEIFPVFEYKKPTSTDKCFKFRVRQKKDTNQFYDLVSTEEYFTYQEAIEAYQYLSNNESGFEIEMIDAENTYIELIEVLLVNKVSKTIENLHSLIPILLDDKSYPKIEGDKKQKIQIKEGKDVVAESLIEYKSQAEIDRVKKLIKNEVTAGGFHLVEHILLRGAGTSKPVSITVKDAVGCDLTYEPYINLEKPCSSEEKQASNPADNNAVVNAGSNANNNDSTQTNGIQYSPGADVYSFYATVVVPSWLPQFSENNINARKNFEVLLHTEAPALVRLNIMWLSLSEFHSFEEKYEAWLMAKAKETPKTPKTADKTFAKELEKLESKISNLLYI